MFGLAVLQHILGAIDRVFEGIFGGNLGRVIEQLMNPDVMPSIRSGVGMPVCAVKRRPPAFFATLSQSMRLMRFLTISFALARACAIAQVGHDSLEERDFGVLESLEQPAVETKAKDVAFVREAASIMASRLDLPAPQSPWRPTVTAVSGVGAAA